MGRRFFGQIPGQLASVLNVDGQKLLVDEVNDEEGIHLVYDIGQLVQGQFWEMGARNVAVLVDGATPDVVTEFTDLPQTYAIQKIQVACDTVANLNAVTVGILGWAQTPAFTGFDTALWRWIAGGTTFVRPLGFDDGFTQGLIMVPSFQEVLPIMQRNIGGSNLNQHVRGLIASVDGNGLGAVNVTISIGISFWSSPVGTPRTLTILPGF